MYYTFICLFTKLISRDSVKRAWLRWLSSLYKQLKSFSPMSLNNTDIDIILDKVQSLPINHLIKLEGIRTELEKKSGERIKLNFSGSDAIFLLDGKPLFRVDQMGNITLLDTPRKLQKNLNDLIMT